MRKLMVLLMAAFFSMPSFAQEVELSKKEQRKLDRDRKKIERKKEQDEAIGKLNYMVENRTWVLEANQLSVGTGETTPLNPVLNFVIIDGDRGMVQLTPSNPKDQGRNDLGGGYY